MNTYSKQFFFRRYFQSNLTHYVIIMPLVYPKDVQFMLHSYGILFPLCLTAAVKSGASIKKSTLQQTFHIFPNSKLTDSEPSCRKNALN
mmetsp:Transcript_42610/g.89421  ORF Transcript_42610/g.89421 Transcript_42610/m.89421 type:complete len:89 (-) Transcript_42610:1902-2168(-)